MKKGCKHGSFCVVQYQFHQKSEFEPVQFMGQTIMGLDIVGLVSKIKSMELSSAQSNRIPKLFIVIWIVAVLVIWVISSLSQLTVAEIPWSVLVLIAIMLGANIGLNFGGTESSVTQPSPPKPTPNPTTPPVVDPVLSSQQVKGEKD